MKKLFLMFLVLIFVSTNSFAHKTYSRVKDSINKIDTTFAFQTETDKQMEELAGDMLSAQQLRLTSYPVNDEVEIPYNVWGSLVGIFIITFFMVFIWRRLKKYK